jgi:hypothetical protein
MAKPPVSYGSAVKLTPSTVPEPRKADPDRATPAEAAVRVEAAPASQAAPTRRRPMESRSDPTVLYLHPDGKYELKRYALALGPKVKVHDLIMEAVEDWASRHGITAPFRVPSDKPRRSS